MYCSDFDQSDVKPGAERTITQIAAFLNEYEERQVLIEGFTDFDRVRVITIWHCRSDAPSQYAMRWSNEMSIRQESR